MAVIERACRMFEAVPVADGCGDVVRLGVRIEYRPLDDILSIY